MWMDEVMDGETGSFICRCIALSYPPLYLPFPFPFPYLAFPIFHYTHHIMLEFDAAPRSYPSVLSVKTSWHLVANGGPV